MEEAEEKVQKCVIEYLQSKSESESQQKQKTTQIARSCITRLPRKLLDIAAQNIQQTKEYAVMILLGAYNPLHEGHLNTALTALSFFEQNFKDQIELVACYLSPSQDAYIEKKVKESQQKNYLHLKLEERCALIDKCIEKHELQNEKLRDFFIIDRWEALQPDMKISPSHVWASLQEFLNQEIRFKDLQIKVYFMIGSDKLNYNGENNTMDVRKNNIKFAGKSYNLPLIIKDRPDQNNENAERKMRVYRTLTAEQMHTQGLYILDSRGNFSSTKVREMFK